MSYSTKENMRSFILMAVGLAVLASGFLSQACHAQSGGGVARLTSAAYQPDSPDRENRLFRLQTGHYGFAYNCDHEEDKRNHPSICWRCADADQLPPRMGCFKRVRHEVAQVSRRMLDGMCDAGCGCNDCQQQTKPTCSCAKCVAQSVSESSEAARLLVDGNIEQAVAERMVAETEPTTNYASVTGKRSGLVRLSRMDLVAGSVQNARPIVAGDQQVGSETVAYAKPPVERVAAVETAEALTDADPINSQQLGLLERLKIIRSLQVPDVTKAKY